MISRICNTYRLPLLHSDTACLLQRRRLYSTKSHDNNEPNTITSSPIVSKPKKRAKQKSKVDTPIPGTFRFVYDKEKRKFKDKYKDISPQLSNIRANNRNGYTLPLKEASKDLWDQLKQFPLLILLKNKGTELMWNDLVKSLENTNRVYNKIEQKIDFKYVNVNDPRCQLIYDYYIPYSNKVLRDALLNNRSTNVAEDMKLLTIKNEKPLIKQIPESVSDIKSWEAELNRTERIRVLAVTELGLKTELKLFNTLERNSNVFEAHYAVLNPVEFPFLNFIFSDSVVNQEEYPRSAHEELENEKVIVTNVKEIGASLGLVKAHEKTDGMIILSRDTSQDRQIH